jgi:hypothetical protein
MLLLGVMGLELAGAEVIFLVLSILYWALMQASKRQATIGKALCGLKVGGPNGERISVARSLGREAAKIISSLTLLIGYVIAGFTRNKQALHDFVASTYVVREGPSRVLAAAAIALLALCAPFIALMFFGAGMLTGMLGPMAAGMLGEEVAMQKPAPQAPKPAAPAAPKVAAAEPSKPAATQTAAATPPAPTTPTAAVPATAKPVATAAPAEPSKAPEPPKSAPAPVKLPEKMAASPAEPPPPAPSAPRLAEEPAKEAPVAEAAPAAREPAPAEQPPAPRIQTVAVPANMMGPVVESTIRFNDLVTAVIYRDAGAVRDLLAFGKWPDKADSSGMTPLMIAVSLGETAIAEALLKAGADPRRAGPGGITAISLARERKDAAMLGLLQSR